MNSPQRLTPIALCRLLNSTPLGEVIDEQKLRRQRVRAGLRIGDSRHVDLVRYVAWLVELRHASKTVPAARRPDSGGTSPAAAAVSLAEAARGAAAIGSRAKRTTGHGQKLTRKQETLIAALLTEPTYAAAAATAGIGESTLYRWLQRPDFRGAYRQARRELVEAATGRIQAAAGQAVETLLTVTTQGRRDSDRVRAAMALLNHSQRGLADAELLHGQPEAAPAAAIETRDVVAMLAARLRQIEQGELSTPEKSRLTALLADALLRAIGVDVLDKRLAALETVLMRRKGKPQKKRPS